MVSDRPGADPRELAGGSRAGQDAQRHGGAAPTPRGEPPDGGMAPAPRSEPRPREREGPLAIARSRKGDGRALILYSDARTGDEAG
ncbi:MAG TPA: hypothetical protein VED41_06905 [Solirubrobacteraceae bacterium]|nr:hypothetical protein [Solirubrobacteraceae bacterium]